jgi:hypothetical protein
MNEHELAAEHAAEERAALAAAIIDRLIGWVPAMVLGASVAALLLWGAR